MNPQEQHEYDVAVQAGHQHFYEHIPIFKPELLELLNAIKKKKPDLIVVGGTNQSGIYKGDTRFLCYRGLQLAYANLPEQMVGYIGFDGENYYVYSRLIQNAKYSTWSTDHHVKKSKHINNVVKEAIKYLIPTQFGEMVVESLGLIDRDIHRIREKVRDGLYGKLRHLGYSVWRDELLNMAKVGYTPESNDVADAMKYIVETQADYDRNVNYNPDKMFVWIKPECVMYGKDEDNYQELKSVDELPEDIRGKLFVLMVTDAKSFVDEVGMKFADNKFWVLA